MLKVSKFFTISILLALFANLFGVFSGKHIFVSIAFFIVFAMYMIDALVEYRKKETRMAYFNLSLGALFAFLVINSFRG